MGIISNRLCYVVCKIYKHRRSLLIYGFLVYLYADFSYRTIFPTQIWAQFQFIFQSIVHNIMMRLGAILTTSLWIARLSFLHVVNFYPLTTSHQMDSQNIFHFHSTRVILAVLKFIKTVEYTI